jgi:hypothetical protein
VGAVSTAFLGQKRQYPRQARVPLSIKGLHWIGSVSGLRRCF